MVAHATSTIPTLEPITSLPAPVKQGETKDLKDRPLGSRPRVALPHSTMIGELKLTALKQRLTTIGIQAELIGEGVLICGGGARQGENDDTPEQTVAVRKKAKGTVELEGNVSELYYKVRAEIDSLHALVAAS